jgi:hypothetical protein
VAFRHGWIPDTGGWTLAFHLTQSTLFWDAVFDLVRLSSPHMRPAMSVAALLPAATQQDRQGLKRSTLPYYMLGMTGLKCTMSSRGSYKATSPAANRCEAWRSASPIHSWSKLLRRGSLADGRTAIPLRSKGQPERITCYLCHDIGAFSRLALISGPGG